MHRCFWRRPILQAIKIIWQLKPDCVLGTGGFVAGPGGVAAWMLGKPVVIHEQNAVAGTTNRLLARIASKIMTGFPAPFQGRSDTLYTGNPVRKEITCLTEPADRLIERKDCLRVLVLGGSQGSVPLNRVLPESIAGMKEESRPEILHQAGKFDLESCAADYAERGLSVKVVAFIDDMAKAYAWADLVICRAGALTIAELTNAGVAAIVVPLPHAIDDHQSRNAEWLVLNHAAVSVKQADFTPDWLSQQLDRYLRVRAELVEMSVNSHKLARADAARDIALACLEVTDGR